MLNLTSLGYSYPVRAYIFGNRVELYDAVNHSIFRIDSYNGGYTGREKLHAVVREIERLFNEQQNGVIDSQVNPEPVRPVATLPESPDSNDVPPPEKRKRGRPRKVK